jgi:hypothetical protein
VGWISFSCENTSSCGTVDYRVIIDSNSLFDGYAWGENIGWINFELISQPAYIVETSYVNGDTDGDTIPDVADNCPSVANPNQEDADVDGIGDVCDDCQNDPDNDIDADGTCGDIDNCPYTYNPAQTDWNNDGLGDSCDKKIHDKDGDGVDNRIDNCIKVINFYQLDADGDGIGDCCDDTPGCGGCGAPNCETTCSE